MPCSLPVCQACLCGLFACLVYVPASLPDLQVPTSTLTAFRRIPAQGSAGLPAYWYSLPVYLRLASLPADQPTYEPEGLVCCMPDCLLTCIACQASLLAWSACLHACLLLWPAFLQACLRVILSACRPMPASMYAWQV